MSELLSARNRFAESAIALIVAVTFAIAPLAPAFSPYAYAEDGSTATSSDAGSSSSGDASSDTGGSQTSSDGASSAEGSDSDGTQDGSSESGTGATGDTSPAEEDKQEQAADAPENGQAAAQDETSEGGQLDAGGSEDAGALSAENGATAGESTAESDTGAAGDGGATGDAGSGGSGGNGGTGGATGSQDSTSESETDGGAGGNGGNAGGAATTTAAATTTDTVATSTANSLGSAATTSASTTPVATGSATTTATTSVAADTAIVTGDAIANASLLNVINTNLVNSIGELLFLSNMFANSSGKLDFRQLELFGNGSGLSFCISCLITRGGSDIRTDNYATTTNVLSGDATTGGNALSTGGTGLISTGNAYAAGNLINFINNNIVDSKYLFLTYNNFGDWSGDVVFPNAETFLSLFGSALPLDVSSIDADDLNEADVENLIEVGASAGGNSLASNGGEIRTGSSSAAVNSLDILNQNLIGGSSLNILFKVHGDWSGKVYGLPAGVTWKDNGDSSFTLSFESLSDLVFGGSDARGDGLDVDNDNETDITNVIDLDAATGGNAMSASTGVIDTGDAYAAANLINVANTNMIGRNMFWAIVNIFGDWSGDVSFGKPDLWIGGHASLDGSALKPGQSVTYHFTVMNNGDIPATDVAVDTSFGSPYLTSGGRGSVRTSLGTVRPGESKTFEVVAEASAEMPYMSENVMTSAKATSLEKDDNPTDNEERIGVVLERLKRSGRSKKDRTRLQPLVAEAASTTSAARPAGMVFLDSLKVAKTHSAPSSVVRASTTVEYTVTVWNDSDETLYGAMLFDRLADSYGNLVNEEVWDLGTIKPREEIKLTYSVFFKGTTPLGTYRNTAYVSVSMNEGDSSDIRASNIAMATLRVSAPLTGLSATTSVTDIVRDSVMATTVEGSIVDAEGPALVQQAYAANGESLPASIFFATPSARELTIVSIVLVALAGGILALRRRRYS